MAVSFDIDIIIPTLNSEKVLTKCLRSISLQNYPKNKVHLYICDGGSIDRTLLIAKKYHARILKNPLKTAEAGKAIGLKKANSPFVAFIDSDNILPQNDWLQLMLNPFTDQQIIGSEPIFFTYRHRGGYIERYSSLLGANDPLAFINGNYDRYSTLSGTWTGLKITQTDFPHYLKLCIDSNQHLPTIGANGTIFRKTFLIKFFTGDYLFDIDLLAMAPKPLYFAKVKVGIIHTFCESSLKKFIKKQSRRLTDYYYYIPFRKYQWQTQNRVPYFVFYSLFIIPPFIDACRGFFKKPDIAWFFHPIACFLSVVVYIFITIKKYLGLLRPINRQTWNQ